MPQFPSIAIIGVGLIGGSIGLAIRARGLADEVVGIGRNAEHLDEAIACGAISRGTTDLADGVQGASIVILCTPVDSIVEHFPLLSSFAPSSALITDAGSTKVDIVREAEKHFGQGQQETDRSPAVFIGSHPLAGDHRTGVRHARGDLFDGKIVFITPTDSCDEPDISRLSDFWTDLGATVHLMKPDEHDRIMAATSHTPHMVSAALAAATEEELLPFTGAGWRGVTRIAAGSPSLWRSIASANRENIVTNLKRVEAELASMRTALEQGDDDQLENLLTEAKRIRDALGN